MLLPAAVIITAVGAVGAVVVLRSPRPAPSQAAAGAILVKGMPAPQYFADNCSGRHFIPDWQDNVVRVYDARTFAKLAEIGGLAAPSGIFSSERRAETLGH